MNQMYRKWLWLLIIPAAVAALGHLLPAAAPFLLGLGLALAAEPLVKTLTLRCRFRRGWATGIGVTLTMLLLTMLLVLLCGLLVRQLGALAGILPELTEGVRGGMESLSAFLLDLADKAPEGMRGMVTREIRNLFSGGSALLDKGVDAALKLASGLLSRIPGGAVTFATAVLSAYMISAKLPAMGTAASRWLSAERLRPVLKVLANLKRVLFGWLKAQLKLSGVTTLVVLAGFLILRIPHGFFWAPLVGLVDAFPILGAGTVLIPWSLISFLRFDRFRAFALLGLYALVALVRSSLEPRLVGRQLGLDPLVTLMALYAGYRLFGLTGMLLSPLIAVTGTQIYQGIRKNGAE